jgi:putative ABC transport system ATP-binding protein
MSCVVPAGMIVRWESSRDAKYVTIGPFTLAELVQPMISSQAVEEPSKSSATAIDVVGVDHHFGIGEARKQVLFDNHLQVKRGEIVIMTGQSGSGKTTLLTLIGTLRRVQSGELWVLGQPLHQSTDQELVALRKRLGFIFQAHNLFGSLTALENVRMALELQPRGMTRAEANDRCREMLEAVGLGERVNYRPKGLSGGQKQRVAVARGLVHHPEILLADEPTAALDEESGRQVVTLFQQQAKERGTAIVIVTHDNRILDVADRIVKMDFGKVARDTRISDTSFIGEMLIKCSVFQGVTVRTLTRMAERMKLQSHPAGTRVIKQGNPGHQFYLIREGTADVIRDPGNHRIATLGPGSFFGETALITGEPRNANVDAKTDLTVYTLDADSFREAMAERATMDQEVRSSLFAD